MKIFYMFLVFLLMGPAGSAYAADGDVSCAEIMQRFKASTKELSQPEKLKLDACYAYCEKTPDYPTVKAYCGVDDCMVQYAASGKVSNWCCNLSKYWTNKEGSRENPLASLADVCRNSYEGHKDFMYCVNDLNSNGKMSDECCTMLPDIKRYDAGSGAKATTYCSEKRSAQVCKIQYKVARKFNMACCAYAEANNKKFKGTKFFADDDDLAEKLEDETKDCGRMLLLKGSVGAMDKCRKNFNETGNINKSCCIAYYNGILIPEKEGMDFNSLDAYCFPDKYSGNY